MRLSINSFTRFTSLVWLLSATNCWAQVAAHDRYALPPAAAASDSTSADEPLINWRREDLASPAAATAGDEPTNPLRQPVEPAPQFAPMAAPAAPQATPLTTAAAPPAAEVAMATPSSDAPAPPFTATTTAAEATPASTEPPFVAPPFTAAPPFHQDAALTPAAHEVEEPAATPLSATLPTKSSDAPTETEDLLTRRLAPFSAAASETDDSLANRSPLPFNFSKLESLSTAGLGLAVVVGLFIVCAFLLRRSGPKPNRALPSDAFAVLGRAPLTPQSFAHLLRVGNKLVLVAMTPGGVQPLTEVTDPMEVDRLTGMCASGRGHGPTAEFQQVLAQLSREPARGFLGGEAASAGRHR